MITKCNVYLKNKKNFLIENKRLLKGYRNDVEESIGQ